MEKHNLPKNVKTNMRTLKKSLNEEIQQLVDT